jgi:hypothetical protein
VAKLPVCTLLGGNQQDDILLYRAISQGTPEEMTKLVQKYKKQVLLKKISRFDRGWNLYFSYHRVTQDFN